MIYFLASMIALAGTLIASYTDIKTKEIPNALTFSMIFVGCIICIWRIFVGNWIFIPPLLFACFFIWLIWKAGYWGGGDAKLLIGICLLLSPFPSMPFFIPSFFIMIGFVSILHFFIFGFIEALRRGMRRKFILAMGSVFAISIATYFLSEIFFPSISIFLAIISFAIGGDILSSFLPCTKEIPLSQAEGELLAEKIAIVDKKVVRIKENPSLIKKILSKKEKMETIASPHPMGLTKEEIERLKPYCSHIAIFVTHPFAPIILVALILTFIFGEEIDKIFAVFQ